MDRHDEHQVDNASTNEVPASILETKGSALDQEMTDLKQKLEAELISGIKKEKEKSIRDIVATKTTIVGQLMEELKKVMSAPSSDPRTPPSSGWMRKTKHLLVGGVMFILLASFWAQDIIDLQNEVTKLRTRLKDGDDRVAELEEKLNDCRLKMAKIRDRRDFIITEVRVKQTAARGFIISKFGLILRDSELLEVREKIDFIFEQLEEKLTNLL